MMFKSLSFLLLNLELVIICWIVLVCTVTPDLSVHHLIQRSQKQMFVVHISGDGAIPAILTTLKSWIYSLVSLTCHCDHLITGHTLFALNFVFGWQKMALSGMLLVLTIPESSKENFKTLNILSMPCLY